MKNFTNEQERAIKSEAKETILSASAGSGKTTTMIAKIMKLLENQSNDLTDFLVITFTNASAFDFREKIIKKIQQIEDKERVKNLMLQMETADIGTLDSFLVNLVRRYFYIANTDPAFKILDDTDAVVIKKAAANQTIDYFLKNDEETLTSLLDIFDTHSYDLIVNEAEKLRNYKNTRVNLQYFNPATNDNLKESGKLFLLGYVDDFVNKEKAKIKKLKIEAEKIHFNLLIKDLTEWEDALNTLCLSDINKVYVQLNAFEIIRGKTQISSKKKNFIENDLARQFKEFKDGIKKDIAAISIMLGGVTYQDSIDRMRTADYAVNCLLRFTKIYEAQYDERKKELSTLDFNDVNKKALEVLKNKKAEEEIANKFKYVFVDEAQDINEIQWEIISLLSKKAKIFEVGDVKQSIYMFRNAEPEIFARKFDEKEDGKDVLKIKLNNNYRSAPEILDFINGIFEKVMTKEDALIDYEKEAKSLPGENWVSQGEIETVLLHNDNDDSGKRQAEYIAEQIAALYKKPIYDEQKKKYVHLQFKDFAVLSRNMKEDAITVINTLKKANIPVTVINFNNAYNMLYETRCVLSYLKAIINPYDDISFAGLMLSPFGDFDENDLSEIKSEFNREEKNGYVKIPLKKATENYSIKGQNLILKEKCRSFLYDFEEKSFASQYLKVSQLIDKMIKDKKATQNFLKLSNGAEKLENLRKFANSLCGTNADNSLKEFIEAEVKGSGNEGITLADTVKISTIHASKGLEYKVVFLIGITNKFNTRDFSDVFIYGKPFGVAVDAFDFEKQIKQKTFYKEYLKFLKNKLLKQEELRLFYVALTRAKNKLILTGEYKNIESLESKLQTPFEFIESKSYLDFMIPFLVKNGNMQNVLNEIKEKKERDSKKLKIYQSKQEDKNLLSEIEIDMSKINYDDNFFEYESVSNAAAEKAMEKIFNFTYPYKTDVPLKSSVSKINGKAMPVYIEDEKTDDFSYNVINKKHTLSQEGTIYHKIMEKWDFVGSLSDLSYVLTEEEREYAKNLPLEKISRLPIIDIARRSKTIKEQPFMLYVPANKVYDTESIDKILVQGVIDLIIDSDEGLYIIDYKFSKKNDEDLVKSYIEQLDLYAYAAKNALNKKVVGCYLINLSTGKEIKAKCEKQY